MKITPLKAFYYVAVFVKIASICALLVWAILKSFTNLYSDELAMWGSPFPIPLEIELSPQGAIEIEMEKMKEKEPVIV